jgi:hypothetical protein
LYSIGVKEAFLFIWNGYNMGNIKKEAFNETIANAEYELIEAIRKYSRAFTQSSDENGGVPTINQIEMMWSKLDVETRNIFAKMVSDSISSIDEGELISSKKENT